MINNKSKKYLINKINKNYYLIILETKSTEIEKLILKRVEKIIFFINPKLNEIKKQYKIINNFQEKNLINNNIYILLNEKIKNKINNKIIKKLYKKNKIIKIKQIN